MNPLQACRGLGLRIRVRVCSALQSGRAFEPVALPRLVQAASGDFNPPELTGAFKYTYANGYNLYTQFQEYCRVQGPVATDWLADAAKQQNPAAVPYDPHNGLMWPSLPACTPVLLMPARDTVEKGGQANNVYYKQMQAYQATLSPSGVTNLVVAPGSHAFPWAQGDWVARQLLTHFP